MEIVFFVLAFILISSAISVISQKNPTFSAISLLINLLAMAVLYFLLGSELIGATQIIIYAGAIIVLFLFVIMIFGNQLLPKRDSPRSGLSLNNLKLLEIFIPLIFIVLVIITLTLTQSVVSNVSLNELNLPVDTKPLAKVLFTKYLLPFELVSILFLTGLVGVVVLAKKQ